MSLKALPGLECGRHQLLRRFVHLSDAHHGRAVPMKAFNEDADVDIHDVAVFKEPLVRNAMTQDLIERRTQSLWEAMVVEGRWVRTLIHDPLVSRCIDLFGADPWLGKAYCEVPRSCREVSCDAHPLDLLCSFDGRMRRAGRWDASGGIRRLCDMARDTPGCRDTRRLQRWAAYSTRWWFES